LVYQPSNQELSEELAMTNSTIDALIVGAGPVGLTLAAALSHQGLNYRLIEKNAVPTDKSKALVLWSRSLELFAPLRVTQAFIDSGNKAKGGSVYADGKRIVHFELTGDDSPFGFPLMIPQNETERVLSEHLQNHGTAIERQVELVSFVEGPDSVVCQVRHADGHEESVESSWLIGCDGAHSTVRKSAGMPFTGHAEPNDWMLADIHIGGSLPEDEVSVFLHAKGALVFFPISRDRFRMIADLGKADASVQRSDPTLADAQAKVDERGPGGLVLSDPVWLSNFRINERKVDKYRRGRVMLAGDAAHIHSPAGGQGMNTGMQDVFNLAWKLALVQRGQGRTEALLDSYSLERSAIGDQVLKAAGVFTTIATLRNPIAQSLRNHVAPILTSFQFVRDKVRRNWSEISINYRHGPLCSQQWPSMTGGLVSGDRLGDAPLASALDGHASTLLQTLDGKRHSLLLLAGKDSESVSRLVMIAEETNQAFPGILAAHLVLKPETPIPPAASSELAVWVDTEARAHERLHANEATLVLVRPDGYIGFRCQPADGTALRAYMQSYLIPAKAA
jgi:2-polyprenyl-6-methoxyphenol hydroxylase-like FAD-dependent oxidoreductase